MAQRRIGVFTIAAKNYLAYVRVLFKSLRQQHPEYQLYLCLADTLDGAFDLDREGFRLVQSDAIGIPKFDDMALRYDIMEFNTAVKPFMFQWLLEHTDLDSVIYLDPDIRVFSPFVRLEEVLASGVSVVLTPHITMPIEDGKSPNDYHMLQAGVFNLGFAAINRCDDARKFIEWWGRRLRTQACADVSRNLFTDQRWCDLAPCLVDRLHVLKEPGYNVAYWNLTERIVTQRDGQWRANDEPLVFFHFSGVIVGDRNVISKHQNRYRRDDLPACQPLFDAYRASLVEEGSEQTQLWAYAYARTRDGLPIPVIIRQLFRQVFPEPQDFGGASPGRALVGLCNAPSKGFPVDPVNSITALMEFVYRQRPDLQAAFDLNRRDDRVGFRAWFLSAGPREYKLPPEVVPQGQMPFAARPAGAMQAPQTAEFDPGSDVQEIWDRLPAAVRRLLAPAVDAVLSEILPQTGAERGVVVPVGSRVAALRQPASIKQLLGGKRYISNLMHLFWSMRVDLHQAFDLDTAQGQERYAVWFDALMSVGAARRRSPAPARPGANLIGYAHAEIGMGEHVRMTAAALQGTSVQFGVVNFNIGVSSRQQATLEHGDVVAGNPFAANLFHVNADQMLVAYQYLGHEFFARRYNIGYWAWELARFPAELMPAAKLVDEIWAPSRFIQAAYGEGAEVPVEYMPLCVSLPEFPRLGRRQFGIRDDAFAFLFTFDFHSYPERKNPYAAIEAFHRAFPDRSTDVCLIIKVMHGEDNSPQWQHMISLIDDDKRILVINKTLSRVEILALFDASDCYLSLHRAEGFGRGPAEAMYLGKPVIVTNYSGNTDFTLPDNSCLVDFRLIPVEEGQYPFHAGQVWADPDAAHAAWYMQKLHRDRGFAAELGARGRAHIHQNFNPRVIGALYETRLRKLRLT